MAGNSKKEAQPGSSNESSTDADSVADADGTASATTTTTTKESSSLTSPPTTTKPPIRIRKRFLTLFGLILFFGGFYLGSVTVLKQGGLIERDPILENDSLREFIDLRLIPAVNESWSSMLILGEGDERAGAAAASRPGEALADEMGSTDLVKHPVVMIPGFVTSGLEVWRAEECLGKNFRKRIWGGQGMVKAMLANRECWVRHLSLHPYTGLDPSPSIKIRAAAGFEAADYFISTFWVFGKIIQNLADVGYDPNSMAMMPYDWRMTFQSLERRDRFLSRLKRQVEAMHDHMGEKVVLMSHSMGGTLTLYFMKWVCTGVEEGGGGGGEDWVEKHVHSFVNLAGTILGVPKTLPALLSGELKETVAFNGMMQGTLVPVLEQYLGKKKRKDLFATFGSLWSMLPKGGRVMWEVGADLPPEEDGSVVPVVKFNISAAVSDGRGENSCTSESAEEDNPACPAGPNVGELAARTNRTDSVDAVDNDDARIAVADFRKKENHTIDDLVRFLLDWGGGFGPDLVSARHHSYGSEGGVEGKRKGPSTERWHDPLATPLPSAPSAAIYCMYGVGLPTERAYSYVDAEGGAAAADGRPAPDPPFVIDHSVADPASDIEFGVRKSDGDGSVPLLSLGYMCASGWRGRGALNPSGMAVITREFEHNETFEMSDPFRSGPGGSEHCDILGNAELISDILKIVTGIEEESLEDRIVSDIRGIAERVEQSRTRGDGV